MCRSQKKSVNLRTNVGKILLWLIPFILFDLMDEQINAYNERNDFNLVNLANQFIKLVLLLLEWYHLYRLCIFTTNYFTLLALNYYLLYIME